MTRRPAPPRPGRRESAAPHDPATRHCAGRPGAGQRGPVREPRQPSRHRPRRARPAHPQRRAHPLIRLPPHLPIRKRRAATPCHRRALKRRSARPLRAWGWVGSSCAPRPRLPCWAEGQAGPARSSPTAVPYGSRARRTSPWPVNPCRRLRRRKRPGQPWPGLLCLCARRATLPGTPECRSLPPAAATLAGIRPCPRCQGERAADLSSSMWGNLSLSASYDSQMPARTAPRAHIHSPACRARHPSHHLRAVLPSQPWKRIPPPSPDTAHRGLRLHPCPKRVVLRRRDRIGGSDRSR